MYNRNLLPSVRFARVGGFDYIRHEHKVRTGEAIHSELAPLNLRFAKVCAKPKIMHINP